MGAGGAIAWHQSIDPVVTNWVNRVISDGGTVSANTRSAMNKYVSDCKADGLWSILSTGLILPLASDSFLGFAIPLVAPVGAIISNPSFIPDDYSLTTGLDPGSANTSKKLTSNIQVQSIFSQDNLQLSFYKRSLRVPSTDASIVLGANESVASSKISYREAATGTTGLSTDCFNGTTTQGRLRLGASVRAPLGYSSAKKIGTRRSITFNGIEQGFSTTVGGTFPGTSVLTIMAGTTSNFCVNVVSYLYAGQSLTDAQELLHASRLQSLQTALGRQV